MTFAGSVRSSSLLLFLAFVPLASYAILFLVDLSGVGTLSGIENHRRTEGGSLFVFTTIVLIGLVSWKKSLALFAPFFPNCHTWDVHKRIAAFCCWSLSMFLVFYAVDHLWAEVFHVKDHAILRSKLLYPTSALVGISSLVVLRVLRTDREPRA